jgi:hypothetical protein
LSDYVIYDMPAPQLLYTQLRTTLCAFTYALAVAYSLPGTGDHPGSLGFLPAQIRTQTAQLTYASENDAFGKSRAYVITAQNVLANPWDIVFNMTMQLTAEAQQALLSPDLACTTSRTPWCHFSNYETCTSPFSTRYCKWAVGQITPYCLPINQCYQYSAKACPIDRFCKLQGVMCVENASKLPSAPTNQSVACGAIKAMAQCNTALMVNGFSSCYWFQVSGSSVCKSF